MEKREIKIENNQVLLCINDNYLSDTGKKPPVTINDKYNLKQSYICKCGQTHYDIGFVSKLNWVTCYLCGEDLPKSDEIHWAHSSRFTIIN